MIEHLDAQPPDAPEVQVLHVGGGGLEDDLILQMGVQPVGVLAVPPVGRPPARLGVRDLPRLGTQRAQKGGRVHRPGPHFTIVRLRDHAAVRSPIAFQREDDVLKMHSSSISSVHCLFGGTKSRPCPAVTRCRAALLPASASGERTSGRWQRPGRQTPPPPR